MAKCITCRQLGYRCAACVASLRKHGDLVCFESAFAYEGADNITHLTLDGEKTACGRRDWATSEGWHVQGPDCLVCRKTWERLPSNERGRCDHPRTIPYVSRVCPECGAEL